MTESAPSGAIDVHTHIVPDHFPDGTGRDPRWPSVHHNDDGTAQIMIGGDVFRRLDRRSWDAESRIADMDAKGISHQILSPMPELLSYWFDGDSALAMCETVNDFLAGLVARHPDRFSGFGMVPLQTPERAVQELATLRSKGLTGVEIGTHVMGTPLGDPSLAPFFAEAARLDMTVMVHALHPVGAERIGDIPGIDATAIFPLETAMAAVSLMTSGVLETHPNSRILLSHGGGALPAILPRLDHAYRLGMPIQKCMSVPPSELARRFFFDSIVYGEEALRYLATTVGAERMVVGTDYPFLVMEDDPVGFIQRALPEDAAGLILRQTAAPIVARP